MRFPSSLFMLLLLSPAVVSHAVTPKPDWKDSYSEDGQCYCYTTYDHGIGDILVDTPQGQKTVMEICETIGPGPGVDGNPVYNDIQCGNGPANNVGDEDPDVCPGRTDLGADGCLLTGPTWNLDVWFPAQGPTDTPSSLVSTQDGDGDPVLSPQPEPEPDVTSEIEPEPEPEQTPEPQPEPEPTPEPDPTPSPEATESVETEDSADATDTGDSAALQSPPVADPPGLIVEAERFSDRALFWQLITPDVSFANDDFWADSDPNHALSASSGAYVELLPDSRVRSADSPTTQSNWDRPGDGHRIEYDVALVNAGQYAVQTLSWSTGTEDDSVFVGINDVWSTDRSLVRHCGTKNQWDWSGCAVDQRAIVEVPSPGVHTIVFTASEDGFEMDKFALTRIGDATLKLGAAVSTGGRDELAALGNLSISTLALLSLLLGRRLV